MPRALLRLVMVRPWQISSWVFSEVPLGVSPIRPIMYVLPAMPSAAPIASVAVVAAARLVTEPMLSLSNEGRPEDRTRMLQVAQ
ncbi:hypothetical protein D3C75_983470 [compost metagenome]